MDSHTYIRYLFNEMDWFRHSGACTLVRLLIVEERSRNNDDYDGYGIVFICGAEILFTEHLFVLENKMDIIYLGKGKRILILNMS